MSELCSSLPDYPNKLHTSSKLAQTGVAEFKEIFYLLPPKLSKAFVQSFAIRRCFVGTTPEVGSSSQLFPSLSGKEASKILDLIGAKTSNLLVVEHSEPLTWSLINVSAARQTIENYPTIFPNALVGDFNQWLRLSRNWIEQPEDELSNIRTGLLSGFPYSAVKNYLGYRRIFVTLQDLVTDKSTQDYVEWYLFRRVHRNDQARQNMINIIEYYMGTLSEDKRNIVCRAYAQASLSLGFFISSGDPNDLKYINEADQIYCNSGMSELTFKLAQEGFFSHHLSRICAWMR